MNIFLQVTSAFEDVVNAERDKLTEELRVGSTLSGICHSILQHEALRTRTSEALSNDASFLQVKKKKLCQFVMDYFVISFRKKSLENLEIIEQETLKKSNEDHDIFVITLILIIMCYIYLFILQNKI